MFIFFGILSAVVCVLFIVQSLYLYKSGKKAKRVLSSVQFCTIGIFLSLILLFIPLYYKNFEFVDSYNYFRPVLLSVHSAICVFILECDFGFLTSALTDENTAVKICFLAYSYALFLFAPVLTFTNVLSLFKNLKGEFRYRWHKYKKFYIMSELNEKSVALARSIYEKEKTNGVIVFTDVFEQNEEDDYELLTQAREVNAICLKKDISHLDFTSKKGDVEIFLIGDDESENVSQAAKITTDLNKINSKYNVKIFVFSTKPSASYIIDSIKYDNLIEHATKNDFNEECFKLRRINEKQQLIWNTVPKMNLFELADCNNKTLSVLIVGFGSYGMEFFKMLTWYCQFDGYKLKINIVDKNGEAESKNNYIKSVIDRACPELLKKNRCKTDGDSYYDIEIFSGIDALTSDFDKLLEKKRLKSTNLAFVALGDDDTNIEVAIHLRNFFDKNYNVKAKKDINWKDEAVDIYSVVCNDHKSKILYNESNINDKSRCLVNHKDVPYHIHFIGSLSSQFDYENIYNAKLEKCAYGHHTSWVTIEKAIHDEWLEAGDTAKIESHGWYYEAEMGDVAVKNARKNYEQYEYFRLSSVAKELYQREINNNENLRTLTTCCKEVKLQTCECENCVRRKKSEHMRWNAYTRVIGYSYKDGIRADRALLHDNLCNWSDLSEIDKLKD